MPALEWLTRVSGSLTDEASRRKARLLALCLVSMTTLFTCVDIALLTSRPDYQPPWYGYVFLLGTYGLNRAGHYRFASALATTMFPVVVFAQVLLGTSPNVSLSLGFLTVSPLLGAILLSKAGVAGLSLVNITGLLLMPALVPHAAGLDQTLGPLAVTAICGALAIFYMQHRDDLEQERRVKLQASEERLTIALEAANLGTWDWLVSEQKTVLSDRGEAIFGLGPGEFGVDPESYLPRVHPDDVNEVRDTILAFLKGQDTSIQFTHRILTPGHETRWLEINGTARRDASGKVARMTGTVLDVSARRLLEAQLRQAQKMEAVGRLAGGIAHDFNNLLTVISGNVELVKAKQEHPRLDEVMGAVRSAAHLTGQLLAFSRQAVLQPEVVNLGDVVQETFQMLTRIIGEDVQVVVETAAPVYPVRVDTAQVQEILLNLASNARDAMPTGGTLRIRTENVRVVSPSPRGQPREPGDYVLLSVSDTGEGMDTETQSRVFEPFFTTKEVGKGTGLGMAMVFGIVNQSGGSIHVESVEQSGTTFRLYFPRTREPLARRQRPAPSAETGSEHVLLVEDEEAVRRLTETLLAEAGYRVLSAASAAAALTLAESPNVQIDLVLTDVVMPAGSGRTLVSALRERRPSLPALLMSGYPELARGDELGSVGFIQKPFTRDELLRQIRKALAGLAAQRSA